MDGDMGGDGDGDGKGTNPRWSPDRHRERSGPAARRYVGSWPRSIASQASAGVAARAW
jgi:hypothetical protein